MPRRARLDSVKVTFIEAIRSAGSLYGSIARFANPENTWDALQGWEDIHPSQARRVVALAFMQVVSALEDFVQGAFLRYMLGGAAPSGWKPRLRLGPCVSLDHAAQVLTRDPNIVLESSVLSWTSWPEVTKRGRLFFTGGQPFVSLTELDKQRLADAVTMRNRVAHSSHKARADFRKLAVRHCATRSSPALPRSFDVGMLLLAEPRLFDDTYDPNNYFTAYLTYFFQLSEKIVPG